MARKSRKNIPEVVSSATVQTEVSRPFRAGLYARISMETEETLERGTIETQVELMKNFVADTEDISVAEVYKDSDYSGTNFDRPGFVQMMEDIKHGKINCVIVKDLSRLGRNYVETSNYIERVFPFFHVRFLVVTDDFDSFREGVDLTVPLKNIINEFYSKDLAKKSSSAKKALWKEGRFTSAWEPYGYRKSEEDHHQLIVDDEAAKHLKSIFSMYIYCATCGKSMQVRYEKVGRTGKNRFTGKMREPIDKAYYICQTYNRLGKNACTSHKIEARDLYDLVLKDIQELAAMALQDADAFYSRLCRRMERQYQTDASEVQRECEKLEVRNQEIDDLFLNLYTDKAKGILSEQRFLKLTSAMEQEQEANRKRLQDLSLLIRRTESQESDVQTFIHEIRQYAAIQELDEAMLHRLISRIVVGEMKKVDGQKQQEVKIIYNFVGEIPE